MRSHNDLFGAFDSVDTDSVDPDEMLARVHTGSATLQTARRRRVAVLSVSAAAVLIAVGAIVIPSLGNDRPDRGQVATTPSPTPKPGTAASSLPRGFTVAERPSGYPAEYEYTTTGQQFLAFYTPSNDIGSSPTIDITLFDPEVSGLPAPELTGEPITVESATAGPLEVREVIPGGGAAPGLFAIAWQIDNGEWLTIYAGEGSPGDTNGVSARDVALSVAANVVLDAPQPFTFPFRLGYVPEGFDATGADRSLDLDAQRRSAGLTFDLSGTSDYPLTLIINAEDTAGIPEGFSPNTEVGSYQAQLIDVAGVGPSLSVFDVEGFLITVEVSAEDGPVDEAALRRIAESIEVIPGAATDPSVWTTQPIG